MRHNFAVFIPSYKRADTMLSVDTLRRIGYTGTIYIVCDDSDDQLERYKQNFDNVLVFSKLEYLDKIDMMDNFKRMNTVTYARHAIYDFADELGVEYFLVMDDDISNIQYRMQKDGGLRARDAFDFDRVLDLACDILDIDCVYAVGFTFSGAYFGGAYGIYQKRVYSNFFGVYMNKACKRIDFKGTFNEDLNALYTHPMVGKCLLSTTDIAITTCSRSSNEGGLHDCYVGDSSYASNLYSISYYSIIANPCLSMKIGRRGETSLVNRWDTILPKILSEAVKK